MKKQQSALKLSPPKYDCYTLAISTVQLMPYSYFLTKPNEKKK